MVLELLINAGYETVQHSWAVSTLVVKYIVLVQLLNMTQKRSFSVEEFVSGIENYSYETITAIVILGAAFTAVGIKPEPLLTFVSEFIALAYFAILFWRY